MKRKLNVFIATLMLICLFIFSGCSSCERALKSCSSDMGGGLDRRVSVYDYEGDLILQVEGLIDIDDNENGSIMFDCNGKRYVFYNAIVIIEEI